MAHMTRKAISEDTRAARSYKLQATCYLLPVTSHKLQAAGHLRRLDLHAEARAEGTRGARGAAGGGARPASSRLIDGLISGQFTANPR